MKLTTLAAATCSCLLAGAGTLNGGQPLSLQVSPVVTPSPEFFRSSSIDLDGLSAPRFSVVQYPNLPAGVYEVTAVLVGTRGTRATANRVVRVVPMPGSAAYR